MSNTAEIKKENIAHVNSADFKPTGRLKSRAEKMSEEDQQAAANLRVIWKQFKQRTGMTQIQFVTMDCLGWTQGNFSQYLTAKVPLGMKATIKLAEALECDPGDIRPELKNPRMAAANKEMATQLAMALEVLRNGGTEGNDDLIKQIESTLTSPAVAHSILTENPDIIAKGLMA